MSLSEDEVSKVAHLARLGVGEDERRGYAQELSRILNLVEEMSQVDTDGVEPLAHPLESSQRMREDRVTEVAERERAQALASMAEEGLYLVPRVIG